MPSLFSFIIKLIVYPLSTVNIFTCTLLISISFILPTYLTWLFPTCAYRRRTYTPHRLAITMLIKLATSGEEQSIKAQVLTRREGCWHMVRVARPRILTLLIRQGAESNASQFRRIPFRAGPLSRTNAAFARDLQRPQAMRLILIWVFRCVFGCTTYAVRCGGIGAN